MSLFLLLFVMSVGMVRTTHFFLPIPKHLGLLTGSEKYRIVLDPAVGSPSPPPKSEMNKGNMIYVSGAQPSTTYEVSIFYTNSSLQDVLLWRGIAYTPPNPPTNLTITKIKYGRFANISWYPPKYGSFSSYSLTLFNLTDRATLLHSIPLTKNVTFCVLHNLIAGGSYEVHVRTMLKNKEGMLTSEMSVSGNFTLKPNPPAKFIMYFRNETTLMIMWHSSALQTIFTSYKAFIIPPSSGQSTVFVKKEVGSSDAPKAEFTNLVPGRPYNIYVQTISNGEYSSEVVDQYRSLPLPPTFLTYDKNSLTPGSVRIEWQPPANLCEFDKYKIWINDPSIASIIKYRNESTNCDLRDDAFLPGRSYQIVVKTLSANVESRSVSLDITFRPLPILDLQSISKDLKSEWNKEPLLHYTIKWRANNASYQHLFKVMYFEMDFQNGVNNTLTIVDANEYQLDILLLPGRNYCISVQAVSHGVESDRVIIYQVTNPSTPLIEKIIFNGDDFLLTWRSYVNSRQEYYTVNVTSDDFPIQSRNIKTKEAKLSVSQLHPGAMYNIKIIAFSHGFESIPEEYKHVVYPEPPSDLIIERNANNSMIIRWRAPLNTIFLAYWIAYQGGEELTWHERTVFDKNATEVEIKEVVGGERYHIRVSTVTYNKVKCLRPLETSYIIPPNPITNILNFEGGPNSTNVILCFKRPPGRIDHYEILLIDHSNQIITENITNDNNLHLSFPRISVGNLKPGIEYALNLTCVSRGLRSVPKRAVTRLKPLITSKVIFIHNESLTSLTLQYTPTNLSLTYFDTYKFQISDFNSTIKYKSINDTNRTVTFNNLTPGKMYIFKMWTVASNVPSAQPLEIHERLRPEQVSYIVAQTITDRSIELIWDKPSGEYDDFEVQYFVGGNLLRCNSTHQPYIVFNALQPYHSYSFTVTVRSGYNTQNKSTILRYSTSKTANFTTQESIPGKIEEFHPTRIQPSEIEFSWHLPHTSRNGILLKYFLTYNSYGSSIYKGLDIVPTHPRAIIKNLNPGEKYIFRIRAETKPGFGPPTEWIQTMPIWSPPKPNSGVMPREIEITERSIKIQFDKEFFSEENGHIIGYTVIVAEDIRKNISNIRLPSWFQVQSSSKWSPYQAIDPYYPFTSETVENFTIGEENCSDPLTRSYCNGPLRSGSTYYVKIRAFTSADSYADTEFSLPISTNLNKVFSAKELFKKQLLDNVMFIGIVGCCLFASLVCVCERMLRTRERFLSRNEIRCIGRHVIHSASAVNNPISQLQHPFKSECSNNHKNELLSTILNNERTKLKMKVLLHEKETHSLPKYISRSNLKNFGPSHKLRTIERDDILPQRFFDMDIF